MRVIDLVVIHCSASPNGRWNTAADVNAWHAARTPPFLRGFKPYCNFFNPDLKSIGYHFVIGTNGAIWTGRHLEEMGAHAAGWNDKSIGICMIGTDRFTGAAWDALRAVVSGFANVIAGRRNLILRKETWQPGQGIDPAVAIESYQRMNVRVCGHRDLPDVHKSCPGFTVADWLKAGMVPAADHLLPQADPPPAQAMQAAA